MYKQKENTINFQKCWGDNGTVYSQTINISAETLSKLQSILQAELLLPKWHEDDHIKRMYLKTQINRKGSIVFLNLTQRDFFNKWLKLPLKDRNTCLNIL